MRDKPVVVVITLLGGAIAAVMCLVNGMQLMTTLLIVLISLIAFLIIGIVANKIYAKIKDELDSKLARERFQKESEKFEREKRENELAIARENGERPPEASDETEPDYMQEPPLESEE
ncbi:MAG: hypothetical protein K5655_05675 [Lachnospiraceae bacterium]|nr:hypothetical protein [Lachnospiraceae bacterium]